MSAIDHVTRQLQEYQAQYNQLTAQIEAVLKDLGWTSGSEQKLVLNQRLQDLTTERDRVAKQLVFLEQHAEDIRAGRTELRGFAEIEPTPGPSPYMGLQYFDVVDAPNFFGREALTAELVGYLRDHSLLAVVGASGSGKSSLVRAGMVPALQTRQPLADGTQPPKGSDRWLSHIITPAAKPLESLAVSLTRDNESVTAAATLIDDLAKDSRSLHLYARRLLSRSDSGNRLLLVVDQFEELFTLCKDKTQRKAFVDALLMAACPAEGSACSPAESVVTVVFTIRADFYANCAEFENLRAALERYQRYIGAMSEAELRRAIEEPAKRGGWELEPGLVDVLLQDVGDEPGAPPLLSHALLETWKRRRGRVLTLAGYAASGRVQGAIAKTADEVYQHQLNAEEQIIARSIFLSLTELREGAQDTRRRVALQDLIPQNETTFAVEQVLKVLADARLVTIFQHEAEVAHEALIREWPTLRDWLETDRENLRVHRRLAEAAREWRNENEEPEALYRGARLAQALEWAVVHQAMLTPEGRRFLDVSQVAAEHAQRERELVLEQMRIAEVRQTSLEALQQVSVRSVAAGTDPDNILELVVRASSDVTNSHSTNVYLYDDKAGRFTRGIRLSRNGTVENVESAQLANLAGYVVEVAETQKSIFKDEISVDEFVGFLRKDDIRAFAGLPLLTTGPHGMRATIGVLFLNFTEPYPFSEENKEILQYLANQAAIAVAYAEARASSEANEHLAAVGQAAATLQDRLADTINITVPAIMRLRYRLGHDPVTAEILDTIERNTLFANEVMQRMQTPLLPEPHVLTDINGVLREAILQCVEQASRFPQIRLISNMVDEPVDWTGVSGLNVPQISIEASLFAELPKTYLSIGRIKEVFRVLVENAIKTIYPNAGQVMIVSRLRLLGERQVIEVSVTDNGKGIENKVREQLFKQPVPRKEIGEGAGLGLWLSNIIVRSHQGAIFVDWSEVGKGSSFCVRLPVLSRPPFASEAV